MLGNTQSRKNAVCFTSVFDGVAPSVAEVFGGAALASFAATQVVLAILGGNSIAGERADRSAEFMAYLPVSRTRRLRSKLALASWFVTVSWGVSALAIGILMIADSEMAEILQLPEFPTVVLGVLCACATSLATYTLCWLISSYTSNPAFSVVGGLMTPAMVTIMQGINVDSESNLIPLLIGYTIVSLTVGVFCFWVGTRHYLHRVES